VPARRPARLATSRGAKVPWMVAACRAEGLRPIDGPFGRTFTFADPDGYHVTLHDRA